jgi:hypothetical protein
VIIGSALSIDHLRQILGLFGLRRAPEVAAATATSLSARAAVSC